MIRLKVNGKESTFDGDPDMPLLWYLRDVAGLTGTKFGCGMALCGACTGHQNGEAIRSCTTAMKDVGNGERAESLDGDQSSAMRILPDRPDYAGDCVSQS